LPHLSAARDLTRLLQVDSRRAVRSGDLDTAAENTAALVRMARHIGGRSVIEALVGFAILSVAGDLAVDSAGAWNQSQRTLLLREFERIGGRDPLAADAMLANEQRVSREAGLPGPDVDHFRRTQQETMQWVSESLRLLRR
jgi:hypothetical protein